MTVALVVGSLHMDLIATAAALPTPGASITGDAFAMSPGGKAGNQAVQLARLGIPTALVSRVGVDHLGDRLTEAMAAVGVDTTALARDPDRATGASTVIAGGGDYLSVIVPGAAAALARADLDALAPSLASAEVVVAQLELPAAVCRVVAGWAAERGIPLVLNASPLPTSLTGEIEETIRLSGTIVVNREEAARLAGRPVASAPDAHEAAEAIEGRHGVATVVITLGDAGALCRHGDGVDYHPAWPVKLVDTVGAGDAFLGAFVAARLEGRSIPLALQRATAAGALAATARGAHAGMPDADQLQAFVDRGPVHRGASRRRVGGTR